MDGSDKDLNENTQPQQVIARCPCVKIRAPPSIRAANALVRLPDRERVVITLRDVEGRIPAEVCSILNISAKEQRLLLHRARAFVRAQLEEYLNTRHPTHGPNSDSEPT
jgi:DNA-directed RNA polymerase specialized sigma24 family protein